MAGPQIRKKTGSGLYEVEKPRMLPQITNLNKGKIRKWGLYKVKNDRLSGEPMRIEIIFDKSRKFCVVWIS